MSPVATKAAGAFRTISEVSADLDVPQHVLRFWETRFPQIHPMKRGGGRRYYRPEDVELLRRIRSLLYTEGYTIKGVQRVLDDEPGAQPPLPLYPDEPDEPESPSLLPDDTLRTLRAVLEDLYAMRRSLRGEG